MSRAALDDCLECDPVNSGTGFLCLAAVVPLQCFGPVTCKERRESRQSLDAPSLIRKLDLSDSPGPPPCINCVAVNGTLKGLHRDSAPR